MLKRLKAYITPNTLLYFSSFLVVLFGYLATYVAIEGGLSSSNTDFQVATFLGGFIYVVSFITATWLLVGLMKEFYKIYKTREEAKTQKPA